jgi:sugar phosphate isomerase/epimerase
MDCQGISRRAFLAKAGAASAASIAALSGVDAVSAMGWPPPVVVFSKVYQGLKLNFEEAAAITAEAGLDGIDCPVRPGGEVLPERVADDLPRYFELLSKHRVGMPLLTTAITSPASLQAESILRTAKALGIQYYRVGYFEKREGAAAEPQMREIRSGFKDLAALNKQIGLTALFQNHSPSGRSCYVGADLLELEQVLAGFNPEQFGVAFDIGHALVVHGTEWCAHYDKLKPRVRIVYVKDVKRGTGWVPFGEGDVGATGFFKLLKSGGYTAPVSLHIEYDWEDKGKKKDRSMLLNALQNSTKVLRGWLNAA